MTDPTIARTSDSTDPSVGSGAEGVPSPVERPAEPVTTTSAAQEAAGRLLNVNARRRKVRRWLFWGTLPVSILAGVLVIKLLSLYAFAHMAIASYMAGDYEDTIRQSSWQAPLNWFEPFKAPFNLGVGLAAAGKLTEAQDAFEEALPLAEGLEVCGVRFNLALVLELRGDESKADGNIADSTVRYREALEVLDAAPEECNSDEADQKSSDPNRSMGDSLDETEERLQQKQDQNEGSGKGDTDPQDEGEGTEAEGEKPQETPKDTPTEEQLKELEQKLGEGAEELQDYDTENRGDQEGPSGADKPW
ncbi:hypothetical protein GCM10022198_14390 [Klugiella xanthotipulae]|uniref:Tetratricopeptide repeat protein n=1 Tax=Klugiella xanthotipulae TaxID=244735 RepID=A0A543I4K7_9MICO|nr:tetratricopeptide repeat protein [Klugiella xanthotipulae]TQM65528.1 hypothetical protein FB466_0332 [Klugiella xanthotipulae]